MSRGSTISSRTWHFIGQSCMPRDGKALKRTGCLQKWVAAGLCVWIAGGVGWTSNAPAAEEPSGTVIGSSEDTGFGLEKLKERTRVITTQTVAPAAGGAVTNLPATTWEWHLGWVDWDGLHFELRHRTLLSERISRITNLHAVVLEETKMAGKIGAKIAVDAAAFATSGDLDGFDNGTELRRARIYAKGDCLLVLPVSYQIEVGYIPEEFYLENSYLRFHNVGFLGDLQLGQFQVPMGLVNYGSSRDMMFMESASPLQALAPGVNAGVPSGAPDARRARHLGGRSFHRRGGDDFGDATKGFGRMVARMTGLPIYDFDPQSPGRQRLLHLGLSGSLLYAGDSTVRFRSRPESHLAPYVVDTGEIAAEGSYGAGVEAAWVQGPLCVQGEFLHTWVRGADGVHESFHGLYASVNWFLTGESRPYDRKKGIFDRVVPRQNFNFGEGGWGAWELTARCSYLDLDDGNIDGGRLSMLMAGVNWHLHSHVKWRFNYGFGHVTQAGDGDSLNVFQTRIEFDF
ncbi:MAG: hypothetical protein HC814_00935 [Rhodobacteraceae bacterium]|nr:hypothetical protein [Paracoccaceae bacterium]